VAGFPIVGMGASAGGLSAFESFFSAMPANEENGTSFVLVQHLAPDHKSILAELVRRYTKMEVFEVEDGMKVRPNCTYIIPPNRDMALLQGRLQLREPGATRGLRLPIDFFFRSLAHDQRERAICVVLSGTGSDGTAGLRAIKDEGGMVMAQSPDSTDHDGMPSSAISTGLVDYVLPPAEMPARLMAYLGQVSGTAVPEDPSAVTDDEDAFSELFILLRAHTRHDFSKYKRNTIARRVGRRMAVHRMERLVEYVGYLQSTPLELDALFRDFLIGVTSFFRDPQAFEALEKEIVPRLFAGKSPGASIRVWVPGCSTGQEAYSIAILLVEAMQSLKCSFRVQVFATDVDDGAIRQARRGVYPAGAVADVSPERLARFFVQDPEDGGDHGVHKSIRDLLVFSEQDVLEDPPFSRLDLISCRNLMIYMGAELQKTLIPVFHYALNPGGFLFLGTSETTGDSEDLFATVDRRSKVYQRKEDILLKSGPAMGAFRSPSSRPRTVRERSSSKEEIKISPREKTEQALLRHYAPTAALVDQRGEILYLHGRSGQYLEPAPGEAGVNILKMAREGLRFELTATLHQAVSRQEAVRREGLRVSTNSGFTTLTLTVAPVAKDAGSDLDLFLIVMEDASPARLAPPEPASSGPVGTGAGGELTTDDQHLVALRRELRIKEEYLQSTNEELETSNEELKASNEEMQSINEELQSSNEELETAKEELQSVNEELATVNAELQQKVADLSRANNDMNNLLAGTGVGTVFVDHQLRIQRFTPAITQVINLIPSDVGRPVGHVVSNLVGYDHLVADLQRVLDTLIPAEVEVQSKEGVWYSLRIRPYRTLENVVEGAVITFFDITESNRMRKQ